MKKGKFDRIITGITTLTKDTKAGLSVVLEWLSSPPKQKAQTNLSYLLRISKLATVYAVLMVVGTILIFTSLASAEQTRPSTLTVPVGAKVTVNWKNAPKKMTKKSVIWYNGKKKVSANVKSRKSQKYTSKKATTIKVSVRYRGQKKKTDVKKIKFVSVKKLGYLTPTEDTLKSGQATTIYWKGAPSGIDTKQVKWTVSDSSIASISSNGTSAKIDSASKKKSGTVTVTLQYYGKVIGKATVKVTAKADTATTTEDSGSDSAEQATTEDTGTPYTAKYTYKIYPIHPEYTVYNKGEYYYYLKTDNPDPGGYILTTDIPNSTVLSSGTKVADIETKTHKVQYGSYVWEVDGYVTGSAAGSFTGGNRTVGASMSEVEGGYVISLKEIGSAGEHKIWVYERNTDKLGTSTSSDVGNITNTSDYAKAYEFSVTVADYSTAYATEVKRIADEARASSTDFWEQCTKAGEIIRRDYEYQKVPKGDGYTTKVLAESLNSKMFTCAGANQLMCDVALELGATEAKQYFYEDGHIDAYITYNGKSEHRDATPPGGSYFSDEELATMKVDFSKFQ